MAHVDNTPQSALSEIPAETMTQIVQNVDRLRKMPKVKTDQELIDRIDTYFSLCAESGVRPGVESLALSIGISRQQLWRWKNGQECSGTRAEIIQKAMQAMAVAWEQMTMKGQINPVTAIFLGKNWYAYSDSYRFETDQLEHDNGTQSTPEEIRQRYADAVRPPIPPELLESDVEFD